MQNVEYYAFFTKYARLYEHHALLHNIVKFFVRKLAAQCFTKAVGSTVVLCTPSLSSTQNHNTITNMYVCM